MIRIFLPPSQERPNQVDHKISFILLSSFDLPGGGQEEIFYFLLDFNLGMSELSQMIEADPYDAAAERFRERSKASLSGWGWNSFLVRNASVNILIRVAFAAECLLRWELQLPRAVQGCICPTVRIPWNTPLSPSCSCCHLEHKLMVIGFLITPATLSSMTKCQDWFGLYCHAVFQKINCNLW